MAEHVENVPVYAVLGATGGIGRALSERLAHAGGQVAVAARTGDEVHALAQELGGIGTALDATSFSAVEAFLSDVRGVHGRLDGVANCVGSVFLKPAHLVTEAEWAGVLAANLTTAFAVVRAAAKVMQPEGGAVVLMSSCAAQVGLANHEAIASVKAGIEGLVRAAAASYAAHGLRVNAVAPGLVPTRGTARLTRTETARARSAAFHPLGRIGTPEEVASALAWLLDAEQRWVTGQVLGVDGGLATIRPR